MSDAKPPATDNAVVDGVRAAWAWFGELFAALPKPARILLATTIAAGIVIGGWLALRSAYEPYGVLFSQLDDQDAAAVVAKLKEMKVPYRVSVERGTIDVPEARVHELRMELAGTGVVRGGGLGFEGFDKMRLGATEFEQRVMYRRAMEGELARTIGSISDVQSARVHLVLPEKSVFAARREPASASVVLHLKPGRTLGGGEISGIVHLVAAAVPGLGPDKVALVTTDGAVLHRPRNAGSTEDGVTGPDGGEVSQARAMETALEERARTMLERLVGPGHADVRVSAELDLARVERIEDRYDPNRLSLRSEEQTIERSVPENTDDTAAGVPGAESNLPTGAAPVPAAAGVPMSNVTRESHTRNYEVDHVSEKRVSLQGAVRRLTVAVVVDGVPVEGGGVEPRSREELDKLESLVRSAVGVDPKREDVITVESIPFLTIDAPEPVDAPVELSKYELLARKYGPLAAGGIGLLGFIVFIAMLRRRRARAAEEKVASAPAQLSAAPVAPMLGAGPANTNAPVPALEPRNYRAEALARAADDPATAALVLRHWLGTAVEEHSTSNAA